MVEVPTIVRNKAIAAGATGWLDGLDAMVDDLVRSWRLRIGPVLAGGTEALVLDVERADGTPAVLKLVVPRDLDAARHEIAVLRLADGDGCARLLEADVDRGALLLESLGPSMYDLGLPYDERLPILADLCRRLWRPTAGQGLPTGAEKAVWLADHIVRLWQELEQPCTLRAVDHALACAEQRRAAHDDDRAVLVHGDVHQWNALRRGDGWALVDPDGLLAEPEYDLGILMREDPVELLAGDPWDRAHQLASWCEADPVAIWEWGVVERVSTGLLCERIGLHSEGRAMLHAAEVVATLPAR